MTKHSLFLCKRNKLSKKFLYILPIILIISIIIYLVLSYNTLINNFKSCFNNNYYCTANTLLITKGNYNPIKDIYLEKDLTKYFKNVISDLSNKYTNGSITKAEVLNILTEINKYTFIKTDSSALLKLLQYESPYDHALSLFSSNNFIEAYNIFLTIPSSDKNYNSSIQYISKCKDNIKHNTLNEATELCNNNYYTKALELISKVSYIIGNDPEISSKISEIEKQKMQFIASNEDFSLEASSIIINSISYSTINSLYINSLTNYLIHVDINNQTTYIYNGSVNNWSLIKTFKCSTGKKGSETPEGIFTITQKGDWFFSKTYNQGAKYWVQFLGNYLFHSLPYNEDQNEIVDYTLGKPVSHGCIRLSVEDSKWIYDNIPINTKVIIK